MHIYIYIYIYICSPIRADTGVCEQNMLGEPRPCETAA